MVERDDGVGARRDRAGPSDSAHRPTVPPRRRLRTSTGARRKATSCTTHRRPWRSTWRVMVFRRLAEACGSPQRLRGS
jgi:hypothetical protein